MLSYLYKNSLRFIIDLIVWFLLFSLIFSIDNFSYYIAIYPLIFFLLMLWRYGIIREDFAREGWRKTLKALRIVIIHTATSSVIVILRELITPHLMRLDVYTLNVIVLAFMYVEVFVYYQRRKYDRIRQ